MSYRYSYKDFGEFLDKQNSIIFPKEAGILQTETFTINKDISVHKNYFQIYKDTSIEYDFKLNGITINIALEADFLFQSELSNFSQYQKTNNTVMSIISQEKGNAQYKANTTLKNIIIFVKLDFLKDILKNSCHLEDIINHLEKRKLSKAIKSTTTHIKTKLCSYEIYNASNNTKLDTIFIQSKVLEILSYELQEFLCETKIKTEGIKYSEYDLQALEKAKDILIQNMKNPPSIVELSRQVNLNEFKLKHGFKHFFKITPYNFLLDYKLHEAKQMLETGEMNVSEVAYEIGYKQVHGFSNSFFKKFGVRPKDIMENKQYYY